MLKSKKAEIPVFTTIVILLMSSILFISTAFILLKVSHIDIEDKKLQTQIIQTKIFNSDCFSDEYGIIDEVKFNQKNLNKCFKNIEANSAFLIDINKASTLYVNKDVYNQREALCAIESNLLCTNMNYPITFRTQNNKLELRFLQVQTIVN